MDGTKQIQSSGYNTGYHRNVSVWSSRDLGPVMKVFQQFRLDARDQRLWNAQNSVTLTPKAFDVLRYLVEHAGSLVTRDELLDALWTETYVNPELINKYILEIRKALGDRPDQPAFVETISKRGYRFIAVVRDENVAPGPLKAPHKISARMVGRGSALEQLNRHLQSAMVGQRQIVFVTGEAGIGKTTLIDAFHQTAFQTFNLLVARGQCVEGFGGKEAYYPVLEALGQFLREENGSLLSVLAKCAPTWLVQFPSLIRPEQRDALHREILGATRERMVRELCEALESFTAATPLAIILEDLHWVDLSTLDLISALARRRQPARLVILASYRPTDVIVSHSPLKELKQDLRIHRLCEEVPLERLEESEIAEFLDAQFQGLPSSLAGLIYRHSGGNAMFMVAILEDMKKRGLFATSRGAWSLTVPVKDIDIDVPETLQGMLEAQIAQLSPAERRVLESACVAGERFSPWTIAPTLDMTSDELEQICEELSRHSQFIRSLTVREPGELPSSPVFEFRHSLYRQVVYRALNGIARSRIHRVIGERLLELLAGGKTELASEVALHFETGREYERAIHFLRVSSENTNHRFAYRDSIQILQHALSLVVKIASERQAAIEIDILLRIGDAFYALGDMMESARALETAADRAGAAGLKLEQVHTLNALARTTVFMDADRGLEACHKALQACEGLDDPLLLGRTKLVAATLRIGYDRWTMDDDETCVAARQTITKLSDPSAPSYPEIWDAHRQSLKGECEDAIRTTDTIIRRFYEIGNTGRRTLQSQYPDGLGTSNKELATMNESSSLVAYVLALSAKAMAHLHLGQFGQALEIVRTARAQAEKNGSNPWMFMLREAWLRTLAFDFDGARQLCRQIIEANAPYLSGQPTAIAAIADGFSALYEEDYEHAMRSFEEMIERDFSRKFFLHWYWRMQAELGISDAALQMGDISLARAATDGFLQSALSTADPHLHVLAWNMKARVAMCVRDTSQAEMCVRAGLIVLERFAVPVGAWKLHDTARKFHQELGRSELAAFHQRQAEAGVLGIANSFLPDEPLRIRFLSSAPVQQILAARIHSPA